MIRGRRIFGGRSQCGQLVEFERLRRPSSVCLHPYSESCSYKIVHVRHLRKIHLLVSVCVCVCVCVRVWRGEGSAQITTSL